MDRAVSSPGSLLEMQAPPRFIETEFSFQLCPRCFTGTQKFEKHDSNIEQIYFLIMFIVYGPNSLY